MTIRYNLPYIPDAVKRQRLLHLLEKNYHHQNFLITGQAAQGKSTLAASFLWQQNRPAIWFHLGPDDRDHHKLSDKLFRAVLGTCEDTPKGNDIFIPDTTLGAEDGVLRQIEGLSILLEEIPDTLVLVLDDFESIDEASTGFSMVKGLLSRRFDHIKFFILSRTIPALNMPRLKMEQNIFTLINEDLAFTRDEIQLFFPDILTHTDIEKIQQVTGGWAGGLTLVSESIRQFKALKNLPKRLSSEAFHFFSKEIYHNLPDQICEFLVKTSILDIIDLEAVNHIFSPVNALEILSELVKRNLFIQRIDSGPGTPQFKYHRLFKEFLLQELLSSRGEETFKRLHGKAGQFFWDKKDPERALHHFSRAKAFSDMVQIIKIKGTDYIIKGKISGLSQWLNCLPQDMIQQDPLLVLLLTMTRRIKGGRKNIRDFLRALELFEEKEDIRGILLSVAFLVEAAVFVRQPSATILSWIKKGEQHLDQFKGKSWFPWARAILWQKIGLGYIAGNGDIPKGISACRNAIILGQQIQNPDMILNASITLTLGYVQAGDFANARAMLSKMEGMTKEGRHPEYRALKNIVNIDFALKNGEFRTAGDLLARSEADIDKFGLIFLYPGFVEAQALHLIFTGAFHQARQMADHLYDFSILEGNDFYKGISHRIKALSYLKEKDFENAKTQITRALKGL
ncbi:MAG: protein MalT, partial [Desulfobacteraceae bacterium]|nr:protein MalT [Desulfobacteraceae bacterium]